MQKLIPSLLLLSLLQSCAVQKYQDISYLPDGDAAAPKLNVFVPRGHKNRKLPVLIFIHGGYWNSGNKNTYWFLGRNFARKGIITVIPDYTLSPNANYDVMTKQIAEAIRWTKTHISEYKGNPEAVFITGHSAGGHLAALAAMNPKYGIAPKDVSGIILNDAAGLDMKHYLEEYPPTNEHDYLATWSNDPVKWQDASPIYFLNKQTPPLLIYIGDKTYESIKESNARFLTALHPFQPEVKPIRLHKSHVPMVLQYLWPWSARFKETIGFIKSHTK